MQTISSVDPALLDALPDALGDALGLVIAELRREWERELAQVSAEARAAVASATAALAEVRAENAELRGLLRERVDGEVAQLKAALALVKNGEPGRDADPEVVADLAARRVSAELSATIKADVEAIHADVEALGAGLDEKIAGYVAAAVARLPVPKDGKDGEPGQDANPEVIAAVVAERVQAETGRMREDMELELEAINRSAQFQLDTAIAALPVPKDGEPGSPGQSVTLEDVAPLVREMVATEVAALPPAQSGEPGKDADPEQVRAIIVEELQVAVKAIPAPQDGHTPTEEELLPIVERVAQRIIEAIPVPKDGEPGPPGRDGKSADPEEMRAFVRDEVKALPKPADGHSPTAGELAPLMKEAAVEAVVALPQPVHVRKTLIDRAGCLVALMSDGSADEVGQVVGKDGRDGRDIDPASVEAMIAKKFDELPIPKDGRDGKDAEIIDLFAPADTTEHISKAVRALNEIPAIHQTQIEAPRGKQIRIERGAKGELIGEVTYGAD